MTLSDGSTQSACLPSGLPTISLLKSTPSDKRRVTSSSRFATSKTNRAHPPGNGFAPSGIGLEADTLGPASQSSISLNETAQIYSSITLATFIFFRSRALGADEFAKDHGALQYFDAERMSVTPMWLQVWAAAMGLTCAIGLFVFA